MFIILSFTQNREQTMIYLKPDSIADYISMYEIFDYPNQLNHFSMIMNGKYAVAGIRPLSLISGMQMFSVKEVGALENNCVSKHKKDIYLISVPNGIWNNTPLSSYLLTVTWSVGVAINYGDLVNVYCND